MSSDQKVALIGFGEAGQAMARGWALPSGRVCSFDIKVSHPPSFRPLQQAGTEMGVRLYETMEAALAAADIVFALVPTDQTIAAATEARPHLPQGIMWIDGSSSSPLRKLQAAKIIEDAGGRYIDMAIMAPVYPHLHKTPVLLAGSAASEAKAKMSALGMVVEVADNWVGGASAIKMIRSVLVKGIEAVTAECLLAARRAGVEQAVLDSLANSDPAVNWRERGSYNLERMTRHGGRRAAELREAMATLSELGVPHRMSAATAIWQDELGDLGVELTSEPLEQRLDAILAALG